MESQIILLIFILVLSIFLGGGRKGNTNQWFAMVIMEGRTREVRRLWESQDLQVSRLKRVLCINKIKLDVHSTYITNRLKFEP